MLQSPAHGSALRDSAFSNGSRRQHRDYAEEFLLQSQATDIRPSLSTLSGFYHSYLTLSRASLASSIPARGWPVEEVCFGL